MQRHDIRLPEQLGHGCESHAELRLLGGVVLEDDLVWALKTGVIHAAAADVYEIEPLPPTSPLIGVPNMMVTPHLAAMNADTFEPTVSRMFRNIQHVSRGEPVPALDLVVG